MKKLYGIGTGPGARDLLTLGAIKAIEDSSIIFAPNNKGKNMALDTVEDLIGDRKVILLDFPMGQVTEADYGNAADTIWREMPEGSRGSYLTIGDPMIYSTFIHIMERLQDRNMEIEVISGIPSFVAAAGISKIPLAVEGDALLICEELDENLINQVDSIAVLKTFKKKDNIIKLLENNEFNYRYIKRATLEEQEIISDKEIILEDIDYLSLIIGRKKGNDYEK